MKVHCRTVLADAEFTEVATERKCAKGPDGGQLTQFFTELQN